MGPGYAVIGRATQLIYALDRGERWSDPNASPVAGDNSGPHLHATVLKGPGTNYSLAVRPKRNISCDLGRSTHSGAYKGAIQRGRVAHYDC